MRRYRLFGIVLFIVLAGLAAWIGTRRSVPSYQGKSVYEWMMETTSSVLEENPGLAAIGSNAVPFIAEALAIESTKYDRYGWVRRQRVQDCANDLGFGYTWTKPAEEVQYKAAWSLIAFGFEAQAALPQIHAALVRPRNDLRPQIIHCLAEMGPPPESIPWLVKAYPLTTNEPYNVRQSLLLLLGSGGAEAAKAAMPLVITALNDEVIEIRSAAANALARWGQPAPAAIPALLSSLESTNDHLCIFAAHALGSITNRCDEAIPSLRRLLVSTNDHIRAVAAITLWRLGGDAEETRRLLEDLLPDWPARASAARFLGELGPAAMASVPALLKGMDPAGWMYHRVQCAMAVLRIQGESAEAYAVLEEAITAQESLTRAMMCREVTSLTNLARPLLPSLRKALKDQNRNVRHEAELALRKLGVQNVSEPRR